MWFTETVQIVPKTRKTLQTHFSITSCNIPNFENKENILFHLSKKMEPTKTCLFKTPKHFMSEFMIELCDVTSNPKQQTWVQRENKAMERKIK